MSSTQAGIRNALSLVKGEDYSDFDPNAPLDLDSINRISLISELENAFETEINVEEFSPEIFDNIANLTQFMDSLLP
jgi:acyl carrier protein